MADPTKPFWRIAEALLGEPSVSKGTLMGFPCLRVDGEFFATVDHRSGHLIVKLQSERVQQLIAEGTGSPFAPAGRMFREWVEIRGYDEPFWTQLLHEARNFVEQKVNNHEIQTSRNWSSRLSVHYIPFSCCLARGVI